MSEEKVKLSKDFLKDITYEGHYLIILMDNELINVSYNTFEQYQHIKNIIKDDVFELDTLLDIKQLLDEQIKELTL